MNRLQFMNRMKEGLVPLEAQERAELLSDYEQHFDMGLSEGKSEIEIAVELGNPEDLIKEALGDRYFQDFQDRELLSQGRVHNEEQIPNNKSSQGSPALPKETSNQGTTARFFRATGLVFLNLLLALPIALTIWALWISVAGISVSGILAPLLAILDFIMVHQQVVLPELFVSLVFLGLGILVGIFALWSMRRLGQWTAGYFKWNRTVLKGEEH
ncbi:DUF1700 domain-containing protein [Paenibacillus polygoni]|uniref:DUF1700 domain-containing protein n=1 Tax=Paenibacillus polygoni TaxID=3050112 RepID=A0ABY8X773_9BACL|nr:DUF1700 domain-containing protein [Paenibacillus polygoni]WIV19015.1 DUF1700 domain-containing protein [Paenibacillus polygoni]